jgi:CheY-like chemotaxis protein
MTKYGSTILVVEDEPHDQEFIVKAFRDLGLSGPILTVDDGLQAIAYMMGEDKYSDRTKYPYPTFIITDLKMPGAGADGFAVLEHLKANPAWAIIPTVVLSASSDPDDVRTAYLLGASSYLLKPRGFTELRSLLKTVHEYWTVCQIPEVDTSGKQRRTSSRGKLGERFPQPSQSKQTRVDD